MIKWSRRGLLRGLAASPLARVLNLGAESRPASAPAGPLAKPTLRIALMQVETAKDVKDNYQRAFQMARDAGREKPDLMVFPELFAIGYRPEGVRPYAQTTTGEASREFGKIARETGAHIVFGIPLEMNDGIYDSALLSGPDGLVGVYHKTHLVYHPGQVDHEQKLFLSGQKLGNFDTDLGSLGVYICHDGLFPEVPRCLTLNGADLLVYCVNDGPPLQYARAHAFANMVPVAAVNPILTIYGDGKPVGGGSVLVSADQKVICESKELKSEFLVGEVDLAIGRKLRAEGVGGQDLFRVRRTELYTPIVRSKSAPGTVFGIKVRGSATKA